MPDLNAIPGMTALRSHTKGDPRIKIAVLDGPIDLDRACFQGANITRLDPYWSQESLIDPQYLQAFLDVEKSGKSEEEKEHLFKEAIPDKNILQSLHLRFHANHIISTICGQPDSPVEGIAPNATVINIPIAYSNEDFINPLNLSRAISTAIEQGVNIIHCAACHPTQSGLAHEFIDKAIRQAQANNILVIAPGGNDKGECWCVPAVLENVLTVGAMKDTGEPFKFSNFGGKYATQGILAPGENILGAQPGTDDPIRKKGTSCAAPIVTGTAALLMSLQLEQGLSPDAEAVRAALINSAIPCDPNEVEEPERCLLGKINIAGAYELITGQKLSSLPSSITENAITSPILSGKYILDPQPIATGSFKIYKAVDATNPGVNLAIKVYQLNLEEQLATGNKTFFKSLSKEMANEALKREIQALTELKHPRIIKLLDYGVDEHTDNEFLVLEWMDWNLEDYLQVYPYKDWHDFYINIALPILEGLEFCHRHHYIHRDIHPTNILIDNQSNVKLADFNVSTKIDNNDNSNITLVSLLKPGRGIYVPPEPGNGLNSYDRDVFAFGILVLDCLTDVELSNYEDVLAALQKLDAPLPIKNLIAATIALDPEKRPATAKVLLRELQAIENLEQLKKPLVKESEIKLNSHLVSGNTNLNQVSSNIAVTTPVSANLINASQASITPSQRSNLVYVLGTLGYDFGTEARRDTFKQLMPTITSDNLELPPNPYDARQMVDYLESNLSETKSLIWTVNLELTPIYAIKPVGAFAADVYQVMQYMLAGQILPESDEDYVERVSIPGILTEETVKLFSGQIVPVIKVNSPRGMYGWKINTLIESAIETVSTEHEIADEARMRRSLTSFLNRIYYDLRNVGQIARDRALNFAATNAFQAVQTFSQAVALGMELHSIEVEKSPFCRYGSECWDVKLKFFDPENGLRAKRVFRFTIDVSDRTPVTLGEVRSWAVSK
ncbi:serine/threonine-protein kinase PK-1 [Microcystis aeruginosa NIES-2519]|uniref:Serine/threonine-protein kinase PK-1 n=1 Tax=Microcystis aeruginosa NIES-2519 TaxID=2303981 RepID=A0A5A5R3M8_MICAE|nr:PatA/PatG family cyanobactin maturation protease [Microcystis aeruginosa]GCA70713.1 serine/threonine-protein kinase PK-1 [Microcystis aeruginosa NIES-2519]